MLIRESTSKTHKILLVLLVIHIPIVTINQILATQQILRQAIVNACTQIAQSILTLNQVSSSLYTLTLQVVDTAAMIRV